ncbi:heavy metal translocating P-type ATPase [Anditalea andensis]|uniref:P-type Zn(2+) transporter n=1 Tax=Anditalea andensis TaxID=1048983 RepID=A0A074L3J9_9BACT|nr:heavy metal translocating P-type ATPase [Anditalea andensis]KEO75749.1 metal ABC transporter ATPase [Anditalea andensis]
MKDHHNENIPDAVEINSPRTAEHPGPMDADNCCGAVHPKRKEQSIGWNQWKTYIPAVVSLILLITGIALDFFETGWFTGIIKLAWFTVAYFLVGWDVLWHAVINIGKGEVFNEFFLMGIATLGAFYLGEYAEGVAVMLFYVIGEHFQEIAVRRSRKSIKDLIDNRPSMVSVKRNGHFVTIDPALVGLDEVIQVRAGERVALDGIMLSTVSSYDTAALTGESKPQTIRKGDKVLAGMVNLDKVSELKVNAVFENSALSKILKLVEDASGRKAKNQKFITKFAKIYTPIVVFLALGLALLPYFFVSDYIFNEWFYRALVFLVISCPCALVVSIPLGYFGGIGAASKNGILFKGSNFLDLITQVDTLVLDKTGTLTKGVFEVQKVEVKGEMSPELFMALVAALESKSTHPIAKALVTYYGDITSPLAADVEEFSGQGLKGKVDGREIIAGNASLMSRFGISYSEDLNHIVDTVVMVAIDGAFAGYITIADEVKEGVAETLQNLRQSGIKEIILLSGDKDAIVSALAKEYGLDKSHGGLFPQDKVSHLVALKKQGRTVAFVGDGINDAPVIAMADVGIAMGGLGSDAAIESADVVIQNDQPSHIMTAIKIGRKTKQVVWQNIALAFGVKALVLGLGAFGVASLWEAVFADVGVALLAILNAVRIQRIF